MLTNTATTHVFMLSVGIVMEGFLWKEVKTHLEIESVAVVLLLLALPIIRSVLLVGFSTIVIVN